MKDRKRLARYRQKINFIAEKLGDLPSKFDSPIVVDATLYRIQTATDSAMDIIAMLVKDRGREVADDYSNIHTLLALKVFDKKLADRLAMLNGFRNAIVHKYNSFEEKAVLSNIAKIRRILEEFLEVVENELETFPE